VHKGLGGARESLGHGMHSISCKLSF
jgi:hypothetical protein